MSLRARLVLAFGGAMLIAFALFSFWVRGMLRDSYGQSVEDILVDVSQLLASVSEQGPGELERVFKTYKEKRFESRIFDFTKESPSLDAYLTDASGKVLFSSRNASDVGQDFSRWNDVARSLSGKYGARSTRTDPSDPRTSVFFVGAPVRDRDGRIVGSVSAIKDRLSIAGIVEGAAWKMAILGSVVLVLTFAFGALLLFWLTRPLQSLEDYALAVAQGRKAALPPLAGREIRSLGQAFEEMRTALEGRKTIERFTQALTHEIKSPLSAIQGAAELAQEGGMDAERRSKFLSNIASESERARMILEQLLQVAALEARNELERVERVGLRAQAEAAVGGMLALHEGKGVRLELDGDEAFVQGDPFLIQQCVRNLVSNAIDFAPAGSTVRVRIERAAARTSVRVQDDGPGIPDFARERVFEKFYSLERPGTGRKSTGLGLSFVKEVMELHGGAVRLEAPRGLGTDAVLEFPAS